MPRTYRRTRRAYASIQDWMDATNTTQEELAKQAGISQSHLCNVLRKTRSCSAKLAVRLSHITNVPLEIVISGPTDLVESAK